MNLIEALYKQGRYAEGRAANVALGVARGGSLRSGGCIVERGNGPGLPTSHGQGSSARSLAPAGIGLLPQRMTAPVSAGDEQGTPAKGDAGHRVVLARSAFVGTPAAPLVGALLDNSGEQPG